MAANRYLALLALLGSVLAAGGGRSPAQPPASVPADRGKPVPADGSLLETLSRRAHTSPLVLGWLLHTECRFSLPADHASPVCFSVQAIHKWPFRSRSGGVLRLSLNRVELLPEQSVNKANAYQEHAAGSYAANAFALLAQPSFDSYSRDGEGGFTYLFEITRLVRPGENTVRISYVANFPGEVLLRDATLVAGKGVSSLQLGPAQAELNRPERLHWDFAPNIAEKRGMFLCQNTLQEVSFYVKNDDDAMVYEPGLALELPSDVDLVAPYDPTNALGTVPIRVSTAPVNRGGERLRRFTVVFPLGRVPPKSDWYEFGRRRTLLYLKCRAAPGQYRIFLQSISQGGPGPLDEAPLTVLPPLPKARQPRRSLLGVWAYRVVDPGRSPEEKRLEAELRAAQMAQLAALGVSRLVLRDPSEIPEARNSGIRVSLASMWGPPNFYPTDTKDLSKACYDAQGKPVLAGKSPPGFLWCPVYAAQNALEVFEPITRRIREEGWDGFDLDHEGTHPQCFCSRCRTAFFGPLGLPPERPNWPEEVLPNGKHHPQWMASYVGNTSRYVAAVRQAVKAGNPAAPLFCYLLTSMYERNATGPNAQAHNKRFQAELRGGYDLDQFLPFLDYANMGNSVYPKGENTWTEAFGLPWAFHRVEATVDNRWHVPLAPCFNFTETTWTDVRYLRWQLKTHLVQGIRGLDFFWLLSLDGRYFALLAEMANLLSGTEDILWTGSRADNAVKVAAGEGVYWRAYLGQKKLLVGITNSKLQPATVALSPPAAAANGRHLIGGAAVGATVVVPPLDGVFVIYDMP